VRPNVVLIDFESVQPQSFEGLEQNHYRVLVFVGATQAKLPFEVVSAIHRMGDRAQYVKITGTGPNALDFHIAFYVGQIAAQDPTTFFHIISKDTGFDPLIRHLKTRHIFAARSASIEDMPQAKVGSKKLARERAEVFAESLRQPKSTKPRTGETLSRHIVAFFKKQALSNDEVASVMEALRTAGYLNVVAGKVVYSLG